MLEEVNMLDKWHMHSASMLRGDKQRLEMSVCLIQNPRLLLLDKPTAGMARADTNNNTIKLLKEIKEKRDIAIIEHDMHMVFGLADRITVLAQARRWSRTSPKRSRATPRFSKPIWARRSTDLRILSNHEKANDTPTCKTRSQDQSQDNALVDS